MSFVTFFLQACLHASLLLVCGASLAQQGVADREVLIGQFAALTGPAAPLGQSVRNGILAHFEAVNAQGGIHKRQLKLVTRDDAFEPQKAVLAAKDLINKDVVFAMVGSVGSATTLAALPLLNQAKVPLIGPLTGEQSLHTTFSRQLFHVRTSVAEEANRIAQHLSTLGVKKVAVFYQNDAYGQAALDSLKQALSKRELSVVAVSAVQADTANMGKSLGDILKASPEAVVQISAHISSAAFIKGARARGFRGQFLNVSSVGANALADALGDSGVGVIVSQVVPSPHQSSSALVREYQQNMRAIGQQSFDVSSFEGYLAAKVLTEGLRRTGRYLTREGLIDSLETMRDYNLGGFSVNYSPTSHAGSNYSELAIIAPGGKFIQ